jgi:hypothetical protein
MNTQIIIGLSLLLVIVLWLGLANPVHEGIMTDRLSSVIVVLKMASVTSQQQYDMIKIIGITDPVYAKYFTDASPTSETKKAKIDALKADLTAKSLL